MLGATDRTQSQNPRRVCLVFPPPSKQTGKVFSMRLADLVELLGDEGDDIFLITHNSGEQDLSTNKRVHFVGNVKCSDANTNPLSYIWQELIAQIKISLALVRVFNSVDIIFWRARPSTVIFPLLLAKLKGKKSISFVESKQSELVRQFHGGRFNAQRVILTRGYEVVENVRDSLSDKIVVNVPSLLNAPWLQKRKDKLFPTSVLDRFIGNQFQVVKPLRQRRMMVGYIGRMSEEKGVLNFAKAIPLIQSQMNEVEFLLGGNGPLLSQLKDKLGYNNLETKVTFTGWIPYSTMPDYLNELKLLVLPSVYEGFPNIVLEAIACGTPVLSTAVGSIPDIMRDGEDGFIMEDNSPERIAQHVVRALSHYNLEKMSRDISSFARNEYSYEAVKEKFNRLLASLR